MLCVHCVHMCQTAIRKLQKKTELSNGHTHKLAFTEQLSGEVRRSIGNIPHVFQFINSLSRCARSEHFTVSCSMHNNWCVEAIVYFRILHCTAIPRWPRLRRASTHVGGRGTPCIPIMTWHNCIHNCIEVYTVVHPCAVQTSPVQF